MNKLQKIATLHKLAALRKAAVITVLMKQAQKDAAKQAILQRYIQKHAELTPEQIRKLKRIASGKSRGWLSSMLTGGAIGGGLGAGVGGFVGDRYAADKWDRSTRLDPIWQYGGNVGGVVLKTVDDILTKADLISKKKPDGTRKDPNAASGYIDGAGSICNGYNAVLDATQKLVREKGPSRNKARLAGTGVGALIGALPGMGLGVGAGALVNALRSGSDRERAREILDAEGINYDLG